MLHTQKWAIGDSCTEGNGVHDLIVICLSSQCWHYLLVIWDKRNMHHIKVTLSHRQKKERRSTKAPPEEDRTV